MTCSQNRPDAVVLGLFETGLAVMRSLGQLGITVFGVDTAKLCGAYSRYCSPFICPSPQDRPEDFVQFLRSLTTVSSRKPVLFITSDTFLIPVAQSRAALEEHFHINIPKLTLLKAITDKYQFFQLAQKHDIPAPRTVVFNPSQDLSQSFADLAFPVIVKAQDVIIWRKIAGTATKGYRAESLAQLNNILADKTLRSLPLIVQELIPGPDTNHWKFCAYFSKAQELKCSFTLQKLRQQPVGCGIGSCVESRHNLEVWELGNKLFTRIGYQGVGSVEFKLNEKTGNYQVIELNARYWQQAALAAASGVDFAVVQYSDLLNEKTGLQLPSQKEGVRWVNLHRDWEAYQTYRSQDRITLQAWLGSLRQPLVVSDFSLCDPLPFIAALELPGRFNKLVRVVLNGATGALHRAISPLPNLFASLRFTFSRNKRI